MMSYLPSLRWSKRLSVIAIVICVIGVPFAAQAQTTTPTPAPAADTSAPAADTSTPAPAPSDPGVVSSHCSLLNGNLGDCLSDILFGLIKHIALFFLFFTSYVAGFAGWLLNWMVYITVFQFGNIIGNNPGLLAAWGVLRDIANIFLLFGFIFMGISTILNLPGNEFTARRALPALIIFAILMNFSLFAAEAIIDTSNAVGTTIYKQASQGMCAENESFWDCAKNNGIGGSVLKISGISAIFDPNAKDQITQNDLGGAIEALGLTLFAAVTAFVFFAAVFMFLTRAVVLAFLMVVSPIGFAGMAVPPLHEYATMWWNQLLRQSFFAPIYILMVLVSIKFMEGIRVALSTAGGGADVPTLASAFDASGQSNVAMVINFLLIIGFMYGAVMIAKSLGAVGADSATKFAGAATFGTAAFVGRRTAGRALDKASRMMRGSGFGSKGISRLVLKATDYGAKSSFDARAAGPLKNVLKSTHVDAGESSKVAKGGYQGIVHHEGEDRKKHAESLTLNAHDQHETLNKRLEIRKLQEDIDALDKEKDKAEIEAKKKEQENLRKEVAAINRKLFDRRMKYADNIDNSVISKVFGGASGGRRFDEEGAHEIREWLVESPQQKLLKQMKAANPPEENHAPAPTSGGGAPAGGHGPAH